MARYGHGRRSTRSAWAATAALVGALAAAPVHAEVSPANDPGDPAAVDPGTARSFSGTLEQSFADLDALLFFSPWELEQFPALDKSASCETIYRELNARIPGAQSYRAKFTENPYNGAIFALGTMWWPAWLLWAIPAIATYRDNRQIQHHKDRVVYLRSLLAEKECWIK